MINEANRLEGWPERDLYDRNEYSSNVFKAYLSGNLRGERHLLTHHVLSVTRKLYGKAVGDTVYERALGMWLKPMYERYADSARRYRARVRYGGYGDYMGRDRYGGGGLEPPSAYALPLYGQAAWNGSFVAFLPTEVSYYHSSVLAGLRYVKDFATPVNLYGTDYRSGGQFTMITMHKRGRCSSRPDGSGVGVSHALFGGVRIVEPGSDWSYTPGATLAREVRLDSDIRRVARDIIRVIEEYGSADLFGLLT